MDLNTILAYTVGGPLMLSFLFIGIFIPIHVLRLTTRPAENTQQ